MLSGVRLPFLDREAACWLNRRWDASSMHQRAGTQSDAAESILLSRLQRHVCVAVALAPDELEDARNVCVTEPSIGPSAEQFQHRLEQIGGNTLLAGGGEDVVQRGGL